MMKIRNLWVTVVTLFVLVIGTATCVSADQATDLSSLKVYAVDAAGNVSEKSEAATFTTAKAVDTEAPSVPTDVKASDVTKTGATVTWTASTDNKGVAGYNVYVNGTQVNDTLVATTEYVLTGLTEGTEYTVEVEAVDTNNNVSAKAAVTFTTAKEPVTPEPTVVDKTELKATTAKADTCSNRQVHSRITESPAGSLRSVRIRSE